MLRFGDAGVQVTEVVVLVSDAAKLHDSTRRAQYPPVKPPKAENLGHTGLSLPIPEKKLNATSVAQCPRRNRPFSGNLVGGSCDRCATHHDFRWGKAGGRPRSCASSSISDQGGALPILRIIALRGLHQGRGGIE